MKFFYKLYLKFISNCFFIYVNSINFANEKVAFCAFKASKHCAHIAKFFCLSPRRASVLGKPFIRGGWVGVETNNI